MESLSRYASQSNVFEVNVALFVWDSEIKCSGSVFIMEQRRQRNLIHEEGICCIGEIIFCDNCHKHRTVFRDDLNPIFSQLIIIFTQCLLTV